MKQLVPSRGERIARGVGHFGVLLPLFIRCVAWYRRDEQRPQIGSDVDA